MKKLIFSILCLLPSFCFAHDSLSIVLKPGNLKFYAILIFVIAYTLVMLEEVIHLRKSKPMIFAAGLIWVIVAICAENSSQHLVATAIKHNLLEFAEIMLFLLVAMTYINAMQARGVFASLRRFLVEKNFSYRKLFWTTGILAFCLSPVADNLTTALVIANVILTVSDDKKFINLACINIVVAANAGGVFSPFGDITTLMIWQVGKLSTSELLKLFIPALLNFLVPAIILNFAIENKIPKPQITDKSDFIPGAKITTILFVLTIMTAMIFHNYLHLPASVGMMLGLGYVNFYSYYLKLKYKAKSDYNFDIIKAVEKAEWDTLLFFYGVILVIGGLAALGYLKVSSNFLYQDFASQFNESTRHTLANSIIGILSAIIDNIPVMFAILTMDPLMTKGQWLMVTLTAGVGGSLLSLGSAAGVAVMGQTKHYSFISHLKWSWAIFFGYLISILAHKILNHTLF